MEYRNEVVRRQDRLLSEERARELIRDAEYGTLSMIDEDGRPYGIPVNHVWDGDSCLYIHCAPEGHTFSIVGRVQLHPSKFTTEYESVVLRGTAHVGLTAEERLKALSLLLDKLSPNDKMVGMKYAEKSFHRVEIIRMEIEEYSGKCKKLNG